MHIYEHPFCLESPQRVGIAIQLRQNLPESENNILCFLLLLCLLVYVCIYIKARRVVLIKDMGTVDSWKGNDINILTTLVLFKRYNFCNLQNINY